MAAVTQTTHSPLTGLARTLVAQGLLSEPDAEGIWMAESEFVCGPKAVPIRFRMN